MNRIASAILFDVGCRKLSIDEDSFFARSKRCLARLILRKLLSDDSDDMGVILFGSEVTEHCMPERDREKYSNIRELCRFGKASFQTFEAVDKINQCKGFKSDWVLGMIVALEYLRKGIQGKRYKLRQIVIFSEFPTVLDYNDCIISTVGNCMKDLKVNLTVVGPEIDRESDEIPDNLKLVLKLFQILNDPLSLSLDELSDSIKYFEKKRKTRRVFNVDLEIGSMVRIPVGWVKLTSESQRFSNWIGKRNLEKVRGDEGGGRWPPINNEISPQVTMDLDEASDSTRSFVRDGDLIDDVFKVAKFGETQVTLGSADLKTLKRESGPPSFKILIFTHKNRVNPTMYVGEDIFAVLPRDKSSFSQAKLYALIDAMLEKSKVAIARRIVMNNGKVHIGVLIPFSDESGKHLFFLKLPTAEWVKPYPRHRGRPEINPSLKEKFNNLIKAMRLPQNLVEEGQGLLVPDPHFQLRCQLFADRALVPNCDITVLPDYIKKIIEPCSELKENSRDIVKSILDDLPLLNTKHRKEETSKRALARSDSTKNDSQPSNYTRVKQEESGPSDSVSVADETFVTTKSQVDV